MKSQIHKLQITYLKMSKIFFTVFVALFISMSSFPQQGINYKALIKDDQGNVLANQEVSIRFTILDALSDGTIEYQGTHNNIMTDANGIAVVNIGKGNQSLSYSLFSEIDWGSHAHYLRVEIGNAAGLNYVDMGTTEFMAVPYALSAGNVSGLEKITESISSDTGLPLYGWRLKDQNPESFGNIGELAVDLSQSVIGSTSLGATGFGSVAMGSGAKATGDYSTAMGYVTQASGSLSTAIGYYTKAESRNTTAIGKWNVGGGDPLHDIPTDPIFEIGIGQYNANANALTVLKNGIITAPGFDISEITDDKALTTKEYVDSRTPLAYGTISSNGIILSGTGNFKVDNTNAPTFHINIRDLSLSHANSSASVTPLSGVFRTASITHSAGSLRVYIFNSSGTQVATTFQFVVYKL